MRWSRAHIWKWKSAFCPPAVPPFCTHWPTGGRSALRPNGRLPSVHSSISPAIWPDSSAGASRAASYLRTRADLPCHEHDAACCAACGVRLLRDRSADSWRAELHSVLADRAFSSSLPRRRVLAIGPDKGRRLAPQARCDRAISERLSATTDRSDGRCLRIRVQRTSLSNLAGPRAGDAICCIGAAIDDPFRARFIARNKIVYAWDIRQRLRAHRGGYRRRPQLTSSLKTSSSRRPRSSSEDIR